MTSNQEVRKYCKECGLFIPREHHSIVCPDCYNFLVETLSVECFGCHTVLAVHEVKQHERICDAIPTRV